MGMGLAAIFVATSLATSVASRGLLDTRSYPSVVND